MTAAKSWSAPCRERLHTILAFFFLSGPFFLPRPFPPLLPLFLASLSSRLWQHRVRTSCPFTSFGPADSPACVLVVDQIRMGGQTFTFCERNMLFVVFAWGGGALRISSYKPIKGSFPTQTFTYILQTLTPPPSRSHTITGTQLPKCWGGGLIMLLVSAGIRDGPEVLSLICIHG